MKSKLILLTAVFAALSLATPALSQTTANAPQLAAPEVMLDQLRQERQEIAVAVQAETQRITQAEERYDWANRGGLARQRPDWEELQAEFRYLSANCQGARVPSGCNARIDAYNRKDAEVRNQILQVRAEADRTTQQALTRIRELQARDQVIQLTLQLFEGCGGNFNRVCLNRIYDGTSTSLPVLEGVPLRGMRIGSGRSMSAAEAIRLYRASGDVFSNEARRINEGTWRIQVPPPDPN